MEVDLLCQHSNWSRCHSCSLLILRRSETWGDSPPHYHGLALYFGATLSSSKRAGRLFYILATMLLIFSIIDALLAINWGGRKYFSFIGSWIGILAGIFIVSVFVSLVGYFKAYRNFSNDRWIFIIPLRIIIGRLRLSAAGGSPLPSQLDAWGVKVLPP